MNTHAQVDPPRLLLVEDDATSQGFFRAALEALPAAVDVAGSVAQALQMGSATRHHLWLVDAHLPDGSGQALLQRLRAEGMDLIGPLPADTAFLPAKLAGFDTVLAMYHDQGLPVLKYSGFEQAVNLTLGLPYPRVAVDHGTALDLAGRGIADPSSLQAATTLCAQLARQRTLSA